MIAETGIAQAVHVKNSAAEGSYVLITGATGGLGKAFAVECAGRGWDLYLTDLLPGPLKILAEGLQRTYGVAVVYTACDLTDPVSRNDFIEKISGDNVRFRALINVAGVGFDGAFCTQSPELIQTIVRLNIEGTVEMTRAIMELRDPLTTFRIINVASLAAYYPMPFKTMYAASKRFILDFSLALREEVRDMNITVTALCPAGLPTTPACVRAIDAQGIMGRITTRDIGAVAELTVNQALQGKAVCIPGRVNRILKIAGTLAPVALAISLISKRFRSTCFVTGTGYQCP